MPLGGQSKELSIRGKQDEQLQIYLITYESLLMSHKSKAMVIMNSVGNNLCLFELIYSCCSLPWFGCH